MWGFGCTHLTKTVGSYVQRRVLAREVEHAAQLAGCMADELQTACHAYARARQVGEVHLVPSTPQGLTLCLTTDECHLEWLRKSQKLLTYIACSKARLSLLLFVGNGPATQ